MDYIKDKIIIKLLDYEILIYKNNKLYIEHTNKIIENNYITDYKTLTKTLKKAIDKYKLSNLIIQNKVYILINKLYCETNLYILKIVMYNLGFSNYKTIFEEELYNGLHKNILSIWKTNGIYIKGNQEYYIDLENKINIKEITNNTLLITSNYNITNIIKKDFILYENTLDPIFKLIK